MLMLLPRAAFCRSQQVATAALTAALLTTVGSAAAATFTVTTTTDSNGPSCAATCSLREAINAANNNPGADNIHFNLPGSGVHVFAPASVYPALTGPTVVDGYTQPGALANTLAVGSDASILIRIDVSALPFLTPPFPSALTVSGGNSTIRGVSFRGGLPSILISNSDGNANNVVEGVWAGLSADGLAASGGTMMSIQAAGTTNTSGLRIGGPTPQQRNVLVGGTILGSPLAAVDISAHNAVMVNNYFDVNSAGTVDLSQGGPSGVIALRAGVRFGGPTDAERNIVATGVALATDSGAGVVVEGNYFGLGADGLTAVGQTVNPRVQISGGSDHVIRNNLIANLASTISGIRFDSTNTPGVQILGNWIGLGADGVTPRPVGRGITLGSGAIGTIIGGSADSAGNVIANSLGEGILIDAAVGVPIQILGNTIGLNALRQRSGNASSGIRIINNASGVIIGDTTPGAGNEISANGTQGISVVSGGGHRIRGNHIHGNVGLEVDLGNGSVADGVNVNDTLDVDTGGNTRLNHPTLIAATRTGNQISAQFGFNTAANQSGLSIDIYRSSGCDNVGGLGEAKRLVSSTTGLSSNGSGDVVTTIPFTDPDLMPAFYSAILTDGNGNSSEISPCVPVPLDLLFVDSFD